MTAPLPPNEDARLRALRDCRVLDTPPEDDFDDVTRLAAHVCGVPISAVSLIDAERQWFKSMVGLPITQTPRDAAFCAHTILQEGVMVVPDAQADARFADNPLVTGAPNIRFYAGAPLVTEDGHALGSLCVIDRQPGQLTADQRETLRLLARLVTNHLEAARREAERREAEAERLKAEAERLRLAAIIETSDDAIYSATPDGCVTSWNGGAERLYGYTAAEVIGQPIFRLVPPDLRAEMEQILAAAGRGEAPAPLETVRLTKTGAPRDVSLRVSPVVGADGRVMGVSMIARDITERKRTEAALEAEREFTHALLESLDEGIAACDAGGTLTLFNRAAREMHGLPAEPLPAGRWAGRFSLYAPDGETPLRTEEIPLFRAFGGEVVREAEMVVAPPSEPARTLLASGRPIRDGAGHRLGAVVALRDVTARRRAERELARLAAIVESSEDAILAATLDGTVVSWNRGAERLYGYAAAEMVGRNASVLAGGDGHGPVPAVVTRLLRGEAVEPVEVRRTRRDGTEFYAALAFSPIRDAAGQIVGLSCIARDITARKRAEAALAETHAALRAVLESAPVILYAADQSGIVTLSEGTALAALGLKPGEAVGRSLFEFSGGDAAIEANTRRALAGEAATYDAHVYGLCLHTELRPLRDAGGLPAGLIGVCFDVTARVASEERFRVLFERSSDAHLLVDDGGIIDCNDAAVALLGCADRAHLLSLHPSALSPEFQPDGRRSHEKGMAMDALARDTGFHRFEWTHRRLDGSEFPAEVALTPVTLADRPVLLAVCHDLTERKRAEEAIRDHAVVLEFQKQALEQANAELEALATTDGMTGLKNHRAFQEQLAVEVSRAGRYHTPLSLILVDVDHFKGYNDAFGHPAGDAVLKVVAAILQSGARETDFVARYGGEEFVLLLPQTDAAGAALFAGRLRAAVERASWPLRPVTASFGVASLRPGVEDGGSLLARADGALYESKSGGRNRVTASGSPALPVGAG